jgi:hypothetical protein
MMQTDVSAIHLNQTSFAYVGRTRVKGLVATTTATGGVIHIFDTTTAPVSASVTYGQSGYTVTVSKTAHGLSTGDRVGITFAVGTGGSATNGNYVVTRLTADTFSITDINSRTITGSPAATYVSATPLTQPGPVWIASFDITGAAGTTNIVIPGEGFLCELGIYVYMTATEVPSTTLFYG